MKYFSQMLIYSFRSFWEFQGLELMFSNHSIFFSYTKRIVLLKYLKI